jgi:hypothetical protein
MGAGAAGLGGVAPTARPMLVPGCIVVVGPTVGLKAFFAQ